MKSETDFILDLKSKYSLNFVGDDCAVIPKDAAADMVITADMLVEDVDFRLEWTDPFLLGRKALCVSLSDIAAMGATPTWAMLSIAVPEILWKSDFLNAFYEGWHSQANEYGVTLIGGDISRSPDRLVIDSIVSGDVPSGDALMRSGSRPGDLIYVSGTLGGSAGGLQLLEKGLRSEANAARPESRLIKYQLDPTPQIYLGNYLQKHNLATSSIDISDGFSTDLFHICEKSMVGCLVEVNLLPIDPDLLEFVSSIEALELALNGGEDFQLLFTVPPEKENLLDTRNLTKVGVITPLENGMKLLNEGRSNDLAPKGFAHF
ncbi:MAG: thiamine-phosphate kinase [Acidobacteriota bacterium]|nr:MAG: thiamine-phosphate kinase [Acidobacteriota bacterium]